MWWQQTQQQQQQQQILLPYLKKKRVRPIYRRNHLVSLSSLVNYSYACKTHLGILRSGILLCHKLSSLQNEKKKMKNPYIYASYMMWFCKFICKNCVFYVLSPFDRLCWAWEVYSISCTVARCVNLSGTWFNLNMNFTTNICTDWQVKYKI